MEGGGVREGVSGGMEWESMNGDDEVTVGGMDGMGMKVRGKGLGLREKRGAGLP